MAWYRSVFWIGVLLDVYEMPLHTESHPLGDLQPRSFVRGIRFIHIRPSRCFLHLPAHLEYGVLVV